MKSELKDADFLLASEQEILHGDYKEYFKTKRYNFLASVQQFPALWECYQLLDQIWLREFNDLERLREPVQILPMVLFMYAHAQFRVARELGFSCCFGEAWNTIRSGIEAVAHAYKLVREPRLLRVWIEKDDGKSQKKAFREAFEANKEENLFPSEYGLEELHRFYSDFSELGTHSTIGALSLRVETDHAPANFGLAHNYFEVEPRKVALYLALILRASCHMERAFYNCFDLRLKLDPELPKMRAEFSDGVGSTNSDLLRRFGIPSASGLT
jgi:hypothetical protein